MQLWIPTTCTVLNSMGPLLQDKAPTREGKRACPAEMPGDASLRDETRRQTAQGMRMTEEELAIGNQGPAMEADP